MVVDVEYWVFWVACLMAFTPWVMFDAWVLAFPIVPWIALLIPELNGWRMFWVKRPSAWVKIRSSAVFITATTSSLILSMLSKRRRPLVRAVSTWFLMTDPGVVVIQLPLEQSFCPW